MKTGLERDLMEGWEGYRVVSSLIRMPSEHPEVMVWLLVSVLTHESAYGCRPHGAPLNMFTYLLSEGLDPKVSTMMRSFVRAFSRCLNVAERCESS